MRNGEWRMANVLRRGLISSFLHSAFVIAAVAVFSMLPGVLGGEWPRELKAFHGSTPKIDGVIEEAEWKDATRFEGVEGWTPQFTPPTKKDVLSLTGWVKYDDKRLYFAFRVTDDVLYGIDTDRWLPEKNPKSHELSRDGWPWFGDENAAGNGSSWQMVCNLTSSRLGEKRGDGGRGEGFAGRERLRHRMGDPL